MREEGEEVNKWKPINFRGTWNHDPRGEVRDRAAYAEKANDSYVAIPIELAIALAELRECKATTVIDWDENGKFDPITVHCRRQEGHYPQIDHFNGYINWKDKK